jgi:hypothetical protein
MKGKKNAGEENSISCRVGTAKQKHLVVSS